MKKFSILLAIVVTLAGNVASAQTTGRSNAVAKNKVTDDGFNWGIGLVSIAVLGVVVGLTAASASSTPNSYSTH